MKYEAVFGDYKFSSPACEVAMQSSFGEIIEMSFTKPLVIPEGWGVIAMRRIISEPKRWTVADQKAGQLPEVGCNVDTFIGECVVIGRDSNLKHVAVQYHDGYMDILHISKINPIETPEEKAKREEDEFVESLKSVEIHDGTVKSFFAQGARAAYRKLKGGE